MELPWLRPLKGILIFIAFLGIGVALQTQVSVGVLAQLHTLGISISFVSAAFWVSGFMSLLTGLLRWNWNAIWISIFVFYTIIAWVATLSRADIPTSAPIAYSLLSAILTLDVVHDLMWGRNGRTFEKW